MPKTYPVSASHSAYHANFGFPFDFWHLGISLCGFQSQIHLKKKLSSIFFV